MGNASEIITAEDLQQVTGYTRVADVERCLQKNNIRYFHSRRGVWTTLSLINAAGGILPNQPTDDQEIL